jgi:hypothetical protein
VREIGTAVLCPKARRLRDLIDSAAGSAIASLIDRRLSDHIDGCERCEDESGCSEPSR